MTTLEHLTTPLRREVDRGTIAGKLKDVANAAEDIVSPHSNLTWGGPTTARLHAQDGVPMLLGDGVYDHLDLTVARSALRQTCERLRVPLTFVDRCTPDHPDIPADAFNRLSQREDRSATMRLLHAEDRWSLRAVVSDRYSIVDNLDVLNAITAGMGASDIDLSQCELDADWTDDRFRMRIAVPQIVHAIPDLLGDYRPPFSMNPARAAHDPNDSGDVAPVMWAGLEVANSETGGGAMSITPRAVVLICRNGLTRTVDMLRKVHVGKQMESGVIEWSNDTRRAQLELVTAQVRDAVSAFCSEEYLAGIANEMRAAKGVTIDSPSAAVEVLARNCALTEAEADRVLDAFASSGDRTVHGLGQAVTVAAQHAVSSDRQAEMEAQFWGIVEAPQVYATV